MDSYKSFTELPYKSDKKLSMGISKQRQTYTLIRIYTACVILV